MLALLQRAHGLLNELGYQHDKYASHGASRPFGDNIYLLLSMASASQAYGSVPLAVSSANACAPRLVYIGEHCAPCLSETLSTIIFAIRILLQACSLCLHWAMTAWSASLLRVHAVHHDGCRVSGHLVSALVLVRILAQS